jgi:hypothetical protein
MASRMLQVKLVVVGVTHAVTMRKDSDGRLGLGFAHGREAAAARGVQGAVITDVMPQSAAFHAGLRNGDVLVSVDGELVADQKDGVRLLTAAARALSAVVWRPRADPDPDSERPGSARDGALHLGGGASDVEKDGNRGAVPAAYYGHAVGGALPPPLPTGVNLYDDLTSGGGPAARSG